MFTLSSSSLPRAFALAALLGSIAVIHPASAAPNSPGVQSAPLTQDSAMSASAGDKRASSPEAMAQRVENRIKTLHQKLGITPDQESAWNDVAQAMRDNEANLSSTIQAKHENAANMSAVDDLASYQKIAQAHADGLQKVVSAFQGLYDNMSDDQKKNADQVFGQFEGHRGVAKASMKHKSGASSSTSTEPSNAEDNAQ
jgi:hypothetical protein